MARKEQPNSKKNDELREAARRGKVEKAQLLLKTGAHVNAASSFLNETALICATQHNHPAMVQLLLDAGAKVNLPDRYQNTPLMVAAQKNYIKIVWLLLKANANTDATNNSADTALKKATQRGHLEILRILLEVESKLSVGAWRPQRHHSCSLECRKAIRTLVILAKAAKKEDPVSDQDTFPIFQ